MYPKDIILSHKFLLCTAAYYAAYFHIKLSAEVSNKSLGSLIASHFSWSTQYKFNSLRKTFPFNALVALAYWAA